MPELDPVTQQPDSAKDMVYVKRVKAKYEERLMKLPHVVGVGIGLWATAGADGNKPLALIINVDQDIGQNDFPAELDGVPVSVRATGAFKAL